MTSEDADDFRTMFMFSPPADQPQGWALTFAGFSEVLHAREAEAPSQQWSGAFSGETLSFVVTTSTGDKAEGMVGTDPNGIAVEDCTPAEAAEFAHWLQQSVLPAEAEMRFNITEGVEWELPSIPLPRAEEEELRALLTRRVEEILRHEEEQLG